MLGEIEDCVPSINRVLCCYSRNCEAKIHYYAFCYLLSIYSVHYMYYFGILHGYPCNITISCLLRAPTRDRTQCKSEALPTDLFGHMGIQLFKDVNKLDDVSNYIILMIKRLSVT